MLKIAHRGYCAKYKENTLKSVEDAINNNFDMIEIDIQLDKNNTIIVFHDLHIDGILIKDLIIKEIKEKIPEILTLYELFKTLDYKKIKFYLDLKGCDKLAHELHDFFIKRNIDTTNIWIASFNMNHLDILCKKEKKYNLGFITDNTFTFDILSFIISKYNLKFICFYWLMLNTNTIKFLNSKNILVFAYTLKNKNKKYFEEYTLNGIVSDILIEN